MSSISRESQQRPTEAEDSTHVTVHRLDWETARASTEALIESDAYLGEQRQLVAELTAVVEDQRRRMTDLTLLNAHYLAREKAMGIQYAVTAERNRMLVDRERRCRCTLRDKKPKKENR